MVWVFQGLSCPWNAPHTMRDAAILALKSRACPGAWPSCTTALPFGPPRERVHNARR
jgi:hypothetical protein